MCDYVGENCVISKLDDPAVSQQRIDLSDLKCPVGVQTALLESITTLKESKSHVPEEQVHFDFGERFMIRINQIFCHCKQSLANKRHNEERWSWVI